MHEAPSRSRYLRRSFLMSRPTIASSSPWSPAPHPQVKIRSSLVVSWDRTGARAPWRRNWPMADKEMIAATLAAGVLAAAPPVLDPLAAATEAASLYFEVLHQLEREAQARKA